MRKVALFATVVCFIFCYSLNAVGQNQAPRYVGPSLASTDGAPAAGGQSAMNQFCRNQYGSTAHICTVDDFFSSAGTAGNGNQLWVQPALSNCSYDGTEIMCQEAGMSALVPTANLFFTCGAWTLPSGPYGTSVKYNTGSGWTLVIESDCSDKHRVACCSH